MTRLETLLNKAELILGKTNRIERARKKETLGIQLTSFSLIHNKNYKNELERMEGVKLALNLDEENIRMFKSIDLRGLDIDALSQSYCDLIYYYFDFNTYFLEEYRSYFHVNDYTDFDNNKALKYLNEYKSFYDKYHYGCIDLLIRFAFLGINGDNIYLDRVKGKEYLKYLLETSRKKSKIEKDQYIFNLNFCKNEFLKINDRGSANNIDRYIKDAKRKALG